MGDINKNMFVEVDGSVVCTSTDCKIENPSLVVDLDLGCVLKNADINVCEPYYNAVVEKLSNIDEDVSNIKLIIMDKYASLSVPEICTFMNYIRNSIGPENMRRMLNMSEVELHERLKYLHSLGF